MPRVTRATTSAQAVSRVVPISARVPGSRRSSGHHRSTHAGSDAATEEWVSGWPSDSAPVAGSTCTSRNRPSSATSTTWQGMSSSHSLATTSPSTDSGSAVVQAIDGSRPSGRAATSTPSRSSPGSSACSWLSSSPRPAPMSTTVSRPASRVIRARAAANSGDACTEVRKCWAGASRRKNPSGP